MPRKTEGVYLLVHDVLREMHEPYGEDIILEVCQAIESRPDWLLRYTELTEELRKWVVNNWIGQYTKEITGYRSMREVATKKSKLISSYTKLSRYPIDRNGMQ